VESLYQSARSALLRLGAVVALLAGAYLRGFSGTFVWLLVGFGVLSIATTTKRIDLDRAAIMFVPLLPLVPKQRIPWDAVGPFTAKSKGRAPFTLFRAELRPGRRYRMAYVFPTSKATIATVYGPSYLSPAYSPERLEELLEERRLAGQES
jgi:hypothetical protein